MPNVNRGSNENAWPSWEPPEPSVTGARPLETTATAPGHEAGPDKAVPYERPKDDEVVGADSKTEKFIREQLKELKAGESCELTAEAGIDVKGFKGGFNGKLIATRQEDGSFVVEAVAEGNAGLGKKENGLKTTVGAGTKFHVANAGQAADLADALLKGAAITHGAVHPLVGVATNAATAFNVEEFATADARISKYAPNISEVKLEGELKAELGKKKGPKFEVDGVSFFDAKGSVSAATKESVRFNLEKGELNVTTSIALSAEASLKAPLLFNLKGQARGTVSITQTYELPKETLAQLKKGRASTADVLGQLIASKPATRTERIELELGGKANHRGDQGEVKARLSYETTVPTTSSADTVSLDGLLARAEAGKWSVEGELSVGSAMNVDLGAAHVDVASMHKRKWKASGKTSFADATKTGRSIVADADPDRLQALRAAHTR